MHPKNGSPVSNTRTPKDFSVPHPCCCSVTQSCLTLWDPMASLSFSISRSLLQLMFIESMMPSNHLILCHPPSPSALNFSQGLFHFVIFSHQVAKVLELQLQCGEGNGTPLQYFCLENPMDGGACRLQSMGSLSWTQLSDFTFTFHFYALEKETATHSSVLAWRIPGTGDPGGLPSMGSHRVGHD